MKERIKKHVEDHKMVYSCLATGVVFAGITCVIMRGRHATLGNGVDTAEKSVFVRPFSFSFNFFASQKESGNITTNISREGRGHPGYITRWVEGMIDYDTQGLAAIEHGVSSNAMSSHIRGKIPDINGQHFERVKIGE